jgi:hypothetical protein
VRFQALIAASLVAGTLTTAAVAEAPLSPRGNFGGGALVPPPRDIFGAGNAVVAFRALPKRKLEIEASVRAKCAGGDILTDATLSAGGRFSAKGTATQDPGPGVTIKTTYEMSGRFIDESGATGKLSATISRSVNGEVDDCKTGTVAFEVRRPTSGVGKAGAPKAARYFGTTSQRGVGPNRPIVLRVSADGKRLTRGLFGESVKCRDGKLSIGLEGPSTNVAIDARGRVRDHEKFKLTQGETVVFVDDHFTGQLGAKGARGTLSLSDRTTDRASGTTLQTCKSGTIHWRASR